MAEHESGPEYKLLAALAAYIESSAVKLKQILVARPSQEKLELTPGAVLWWETNVYTEDDDPTTSGSDQNMNQMLRERSIVEIGVMVFAEDEEAASEAQEELRNLIKGVWPDSVDDCEIIFPFYQTQAEIPAEYGPHFTIISFFRIVIEKTYQLRVI